VNIAKLPEFGTEEVARDKRLKAKRTPPRRINALCCAHRSRAHSLVGNPVTIVGNWEILLAYVANWLGRRSNTVPDDFVNRLAARAEIEKVLHCTFRTLRSSRALKMSETQPYIRAHVPHFSAENPDDL